MPGRNPRLTRVNPSQAGLRVALLLLLLGLVSGCFQVEDELAIQPDGSGVVELKVRNVGGDAWRRVGGSIGEEILVYPPTTAADALLFFPGTDFQVSTKVERDKGATLTHITATFSDVNALLATPYAQAHALSLSLSNGVLELQAVSGLEWTARGAELKDPTGMFGPRMPEATVETEKMAMRSEFRVTLPGAVTETTGKLTNRTVAWISERARFGNGDEFARHTGELLEIRCRADDLKWVPNTPARLGPGGFDQFLEGSGRFQAPPLDTNAILSAARFVPQTLTVTRSVDYLGEGGLYNNAEVTGAVVLPTELAPSKWSQPRLIEVSDDRGTNLLIDQGRTDPVPNPVPSSSEKNLTLSFLPPEWGATEIRRLKGVISLHYFGAPGIVKLTNAVAAEWITDLDHALKAGAVQNQPLRSARLVELGVDLELQSCVVQNGVTILIINLMGDQASVSQGHVFDREGRPWPTLSNLQDGQQTIQLIVPGYPAAPLSLAFLISGLRETVDVPILLENVPVHGGNL